MSGQAALNSTDDSRLELLFSRASRKSERIILPISDNARDASAPGPAFYCVHSVAGTAGFDYAELAKGFSEVKFYGVQAPPSRLRDTEFGRSVNDLASYYAEALVKFQPEGAFFLGGWCSGGVIALEIARDLLNRGRKVGLLVAIDTVPGNIDLDAPAWSLRNSWGVVRELCVWMRDKGIRERVARAILRSLFNCAWPLSKPAIPQMPDEAESSKQELYRYLDMSRFDADHKRFIFTHFEAVLNHRLTGRYDGSVVAYKAMAGALFRAYQVEYFWRKFAPRAEIVSIDGDHISVLSTQSRNAIGKDLARDIQARILRLVKSNGALRSQANQRANDYGPIERVYHG